jgi:DNA-binding CsgD family transcriptional regulator
MGAVEHLKTLCCLGLPPESAMVAVSPLLHEIIPHGWTRIALVHPDATIGSAYIEHPGGAALFRERMWRFMGDRTSPLSLWVPRFRAVGIGWTLPMQGQGWLENRWYKEIESPLDACWLLDSMIGDDGRTIAYLGLTRPRGARPFTVDDVRRLDPLRPWLGHALGNRSRDVAESQDRAGMAGAPVLSGQMVFTSDESIIFQTPGIEQLLGVLSGMSGDFTRRVVTEDRLPAPIPKLLKRLKGAANGDSHIPPRMQISTPFGVAGLEAKWLMPAGTIPADVAKDPKGCLIAVTIELHEHAVAHAARVLRGSGATPTQLKVGIQLALGKSKPTIATELGLKLSTVADLTRKLYRTLDVHDSTELGTKLWLARPQPFFN